MTRNRSTAIRTTPDSDSDLDDLIPPEPKTTKRIYSPPRSHTSVKFTLDGIIRRKDPVTGKRQNRINQTYYYPSTAGRANVLSSTCSHLGIVLSLRPKAAVGLFIFSVIGFFAAFDGIVSRHRVVPLIDSDYSNVKSVYDLSVGHIDHWCLVGDDDNCECEDPLDPINRKEYSHWQLAHQMNIDLVEAAVSSMADAGAGGVGGKSGIDVVFLGESIPEEWAGRALGRNSTKFEKARKSFGKHFAKEMNATFEGLPLGIAGDTTPNVLWRLKNGEMSGYESKVWWLILGRNDLALKQCSEEVVLLGILRVVEEILTTRPHTKVVVNGILPMTNNQEGRLTNQSHRPMPMGLLPPNRRVTTFWPSIVAINEQLKLFCEKHDDRITYFDPSDIFVQKNKRGHYVNKKLIENFRSGQPSSKGHRVWHDAIVDQLKILLNHTDTTATKVLDSKKNITATKVRDTKKDAVPKKEHVDKKR